MSDEQIVDTNEESLMDQIAGAMSDDIEPDDDENEIEEEAPEIEAASDDEEPVTEPEEEVSDEEEEPNADPEEDHGNEDWTPPISMTAAEAAEFRKLSPDAQAYLVRREQDRERYFSTRSNELAEQKRTFDASMAETETMKTKLKEALSHWAEQEPQMPDIQLSMDDPVEYTRQMAVYNEQHRRKSEAQKQIDEIASAEAERSSRERQQWEREEAAKLAQQIPEFTDPKRGPALREAITSYAVNNIGIPAEEIANLNSQAIVMLNKARLYDETQAKATAIKTKAKPAPKSAKPGTPKGTNSKSRVIENFEKNPSMDSLAALFSG